MHAPRAPRATRQRRAGQRSPDLFRRGSRERDAPALSAQSRKVDQQAERPTRGRSSGRKTFVGQPPTSGDGDPDDVGDSEGDEGSDESDGDDFEESEEDSGDGEAGYDINIRSTSTSAVTRGEKIVTERRIREQDTVKVPNFPTLPNLTQWRIQISKNLVTAGGYLDLREITWWGEIGLAENTFETLADSGDQRFLSLDLKPVSYTHLTLPTSDLV